MASNSTNCSRSLSLLSDSTLDDSGKISRKWRESLPSPVIPKADLSIWTILRQFVGKVCLLFNLVFVIAKLHFRLRYILSYHA